MTALNKILLITVSIFLISCNTNQKKKVSEVNINCDSSVEKLFALKLDNGCKCVNYQKGLIDESGQWVIPNTIIIKLNNCDATIDSIKKKYSLMQFNSITLFGNQSLFLDPKTNKTIIKPAIFGEDVLWMFKGMGLVSSFPEWWRPNMNDIKENYANYLYIIDEVLLTSSIDSIFNGKLVLQKEGEFYYILIEKVEDQYPFHPN